MELFGAFRLLAEPQGFILFQMERKLVSLNLVMQEKNYTD